jgi:hypothetical protein
MKKEEKYSGKNDEELMTILIHEREQAVLKIQMKFKILYTCRYVYK